MAPSAFDPVRVPGGNVSVIICTKDRPADLARAIESIRGSGDAGLRAEIVVVEESDVPCQIPGVRYVHLPREGRGFGYARNAGVRAAGGDLVVFMDDDCEAEKGWVEALIGPLRADRQMLGVAGGVMVRDCGPIGYAENILGFPGGGLRYLHNAHGQVVPTRFLSTCNCAYRKEALLRVGGFPEDARLGAEDSLVAERINTLGPCVYAPTAMVYHRARARLSAIFRWFMRRGQGEVGFLQATSTPWKSIWYLFRSSWALRVLAIFVVLFHWPWAAILIPVGMFVYSGIILWRFRYARGYPTHRRAWWLIPVVKLTMDLGAEVGRWRALVLRER